MTTGVQGDQIKIGRPVLMAIRQELMNRILPFLGIMLLCSLKGKAQLTPFQIGDSAIRMMGNGKFEAGWNLIESIPREQIDPGDWIVANQYAFLRGDTIRFFDCISYLCREYGFTLTNQHSGLAYYEALNSGKYSERFMNIQNESLPYFMQKKHRVLQTIRELDEMRIRDQLRGQVNQALLKTDSCFNKCSGTLIDHLNEINFEKLIQICNKTGIFPNNFDLHYNATATAYLILWHNCSDSINYEEKWSKVWPYLDEAYSQGKINNAFVLTYDYFLARYLGYQLFGTVAGDVAIKDMDGLRERRRKYHLE